MKADAPIEVKPDLVAGHWRINPDCNMVCFFAEDSPMNDLLYRIIKADGHPTQVACLFRVLLQSVVQGARGPMACKQSNQLCYFLTSAQGANC